MKNYPKTILSTIVVSILVFGGYIQTTYAYQLPSHLLAIPKSANGVQIAEVDSPHDRDSSHEDGDREASDLRRVSVTRTHRINQTKYPLKHHRKYHYARRQHTK
ncbi:MAG: hypothetical protein V7K48_20590 [Nostoc sp.]|uniref:hypothetical protein n=1 Tax=Nostoc sp. TaxID=1180 RepID=UPI002FF69529